jgi:type IV pilus assembly protein PilQ
MKARSSFMGGVRRVLQLAVVGWALLSASAFAQDNAIQSVNASLQGSKVLVRVQMKKPLTAVPPGFSITNPARVALDFPGATNEVGKNAIDVDQGDLRSINLVQAGDRSRLVLNLRRPVTYNATLDGNAVVVVLEGPSAATAASSAGSVRFAEGSPSKHSLRTVDFRRGREGEGRVVVDLSDNQVGVDIRQQGQTVVVDFMKTALPADLRRRLDVADFSTPVQTITTFQQGDNVRMVIEPKGLWEHNAYQSDTQFVVEVKPVQEDPNKLFQGTRIGYKGEKLSLNFQNVDVRSLLQVIADFTNLNIITSDSVGGNITLRLKDVPWDQALDIILQAKGLDMRKNGNVILVAPRDELATKEKLELEAKAQISDLEPLRTESFQVNYQKAENIAKLLGEQNQRILSKRGSAVTDVRTNQVFVNDTPSRLEEVRRLIAKIDVPTRQVLIEARIVEADDKFSRNLGAKLSYNDRSSTITRDITVVDPVTGNTSTVTVPVYGPGSKLGGSTYGTISGNLQGAQDLSSQNGSADGSSSVVGIGRASVNNTNFVNLPAAAINGANPGTIAISLFNSKLTRFINLELSALEADGRGKVISSPRVVTADQVKALIEQGEELPYEQSTSSGATSVAFRKASLKLEVVPQITPEGAIILDVDVSKDTVGRLTTAGFAIDTKHVKTQVLVENGGTVVIGGIFQHTERDQITKVPLFGDIPVVGHLFKNTARQNDKTELLVFITPKVVSDRLTVR